MLVSAVNHVHHHIYLCIMRMPVPHDLLGREVGVEGGGEFVSTHYVCCSSALMCVKQTHRN